MLEHRERMILRGVGFLVALILVIYVALFCSQTWGAEPADALASKTTTHQIEQAILHIIHKGIPKHDVHPYPKHPLAANIEKRTELVTVIHEASTFYNIDPFLMVSLGFRENSFTPDEVGDIGEIGVFQMIPRVADIVKNTMESRCTLDTVPGSAWCAAAWLNHWRTRCGTIEGAFMIYATGKKCRPLTPHTRWLLWDRFGIARYLRGATQVLNSEDQSPPARL